MMDLKCPALSWDTVWANVKEKSKYRCKSVKEETMETVLGTEFL